MICSGSERINNWYSFGIINDPNIEFATLTILQKGSKYAM